jgi:hypothetical protein
VAHYLPRSGRRNLYGTLAVFAVCAANRTQLDLLDEAFNGLALTLVSHMRLGTLTVILDELADVAKLLDNLELSILTFVNSNVWYQPLHSDMPEVRKTWGCLRKLAGFDEDTIFLQILLFGAHFHHKR